MPRFMKVRDSAGRQGIAAGSAPRWVRAIPGGLPRSPLESRVREVLAACPVCPWDHLVAEIAQYLRASERPSALAVLDEGIWGAWVWPALAVEELARLEDVILATEPQAPQPADRLLPLPAGSLADDGRDIHQPRQPERE